MITLISWLRYTEVYLHKSTIRLYSNNLSLRFNGHFPGEPGLAGVYWSKGWCGGGGDNWTTGAISRAKLQSNHHHRQTNTQFFLEIGRSSCFPVNSVRAPKETHTHTHTLSLAASIPGQPFWISMHQEIMALAVVQYVQSSSQMNITTLNFLLPRRVILPNFVALCKTVSLGYWHQRADERHGNPPPR